MSQSILSDRRQVAPLAMPTPVPFDAAHDMTTAVLDLPDALEAALSGTADEPDYRPTSPEADTAVDAAVDAAPARRSSPPSALGRALVALIDTPDDERAMRRFHALATRHLTAFFARRGAQEESESLAANTVWRIVRALPTLQPVGAVSFLWTTAMNLLANHYRDQHRAARIFTAETALMPDGTRRSHHETHASDIDVASDVEHQEFRDLLTRTVRALPAHYRDVLLASYAGYSLQEMAAHLQIPEGTVKSRLHRARAAAADIMRPYVEGGGAPTFPAPRRRPAGAA